MSGSILPHKLQQPQLMCLQKLTHTSTHTLSILLSVLVQMPPQLQQAVIVFTSTHVDWISLAGVIDGKCIAAKRSVPVTVNCRRQP